MEAVMATDDEEFFDLLGPLDPSRNEHPPASGSDRYRSILELAVRTDVDTSATNDAGPAAPRQPTGSTPLRRVWRLVAGIAAATLVAAGAFVILQPNDVPTAQAAVSSAAAAMNAITSLEGELTSTVPGVSEGTTRIRVDGEDLTITGETRFADGHVEASTFTVIGGTGYETIDGQTTTTAVGPNDRLAPFGPSSQPSSQQHSRDPR